MVAGSSKFTEAFDGKKFHTNCLRSPGWSYTFRRQCNQPRLLWTFLKTSMKCSKQLGLAQGTAGCLSDGGFCSRQPGQRGKPIPAADEWSKLPISQWASGVFTKRLENTVVSTDCVCAIKVLPIYPMPRKKSRGGVGGPIMYVAKGKGSWIWRLEESPKHDSLPQSNDRGWAEIIPTWMRTPDILALWFSWSPGFLLRKP